jgi:putative NADPH-quinone reductase
MRPNFNRSSTGKDDPVARRNFGWFSAKGCGAVSDNSGYRGDILRHIVIIQGHPDPRGGHFGHALADAYLHAALGAGHHVEMIDVGRLDFPLLRTKEEFETGPVPPAIQDAQAMIDQADHLVIFFPLWLGEAPAILKGFFEQVFRPSFVTAGSDLQTLARGKRTRLRGKSARLVVTMGMPAFIYRWWFGAHGLRTLKRNVLGFCGVGPIAESVIGMVEHPAPQRRAQWLERMAALGAAGH